MGRVLLRAFAVGLTASAAATAAVGVLLAVLSHERDA